MNVIIARTGNKENLQNRGVLKPTRRCRTFLDKSQIAKKKWTTQSRVATSTATGHRPAAGS